MTAIAGFVSKNPVYDAQSLVESMLNRMSRPTQYTGTLSSGQASFGFLQSVSFSDVLTQSLDKRFMAISRGDVFNHHELRNYAKDYIFTSPSQTESLLSAFLARGLEALKACNGAPTFAVHDALERQTFLFADRYGELSVHYVQGKDYFAFASEIKALLGFVQPSCNKDALDYKAFEFCIGRETLFKDIFSLEPGNYVRIDEDGKVEVHSWWRIWENLVPVPESIPARIDMLISLLEDSIFLRKQTDAPCACFLSGGLDSSLIAAIMKPDALYHAHYDFTDFDELDYARTVARSLGKELRVITPQKEDFIEHNDAILYALDTPCTWTSFTLWMLVEQIHADGLSLVFTGDGADELFGGYHRYHLLYHDEQIRTLDSMQQYAYLIDRYYGSRVERYAKIINRCDNIYDVHVNKWLFELLQEYDKRSDGDIINFMTLTDLYTTSQVLFYMANRIFSSFGTAWRSPFMDYRLVQYAFSLKTEMKIRDGFTKWILRKAAERYLHHDIVWRNDKRGFSAPVNRWFQWDVAGKYNRSGYRDTVFQQWRTLFSLG